MNIKYLSLISLTTAVLVYSCNFNKSVNTNLVTGLTTVGDGLSCEEVYLSATEGRVQKNTFIYGEEFDLNFSNIQGFTKENEAVFPGLTIQVTGEDGEKVMETEDLYANYTEGMDFSPLLLVANLTVATPMHSNNNYVVSVSIWDKKGSGKFTAKMPFNVVPDEQIDIEKNGTSCSEVYLYSGKSGKVITDQKAAFNEDVLLIFEGLTGFQEDQGNVFVGMSILAKDNADHTIIAMDDLFKSYDETGIPAENLREQASATITFTEGEVSNPVHCEVIVYDKKGDASIKAETDLTVL